MRQEDPHWKIDDGSLICGILSDDPSSVVGNGTNSASRNHESFNCSMLKERVGSSHGQFLEEGRRRKVGDGVIA
jgi:hypothetical protein